MPAALFLALLLLCPAMGFAATPLALTAAVERVDARPHALYYAESGATLTPQQALAAPEIFQPAGRRSASLEAAVHWIRLSITNAERGPGRWVLDLGVPDAEFLELFRTADRHPGGGLAQVRLSHRCALNEDGEGCGLSPDAPFSARPLPERILGLPLELAPGEAAELLLRYRTHGDTPLRLELLSPQAFQHRLAQGNLANGVVAGLLLALALLALLHHLAGGETAFAAYCGMALLMIGFLAQFEGYNFQYLWPDWGEWNQQAPAWLAVGIQVAHVLFTMTLFDLRRRSPRLHRAFLGYLALLPPALALHQTIGWNWPLLVAAIAYLPLVFSAGLHLLRRGDSVAGLFLAGALVNAIFTNLLFGLGVYGLDLHFSPFLFPKIGYLGEAVFFAAALARQTHSLRRQVEDGLRLRLAEAEHLARAEAEKHRALQEAQQHQLQLAATGHDLSQPLASIRFALAALGSRLAGSDEGAAATRHIDETLNYTEALLRGLVSDARRGYLEQEKELDLDEVLLAACNRHALSARRTGLRLRRCPTAWSVRASPLVLGRILDNLVANAIRYTERGGVLLGVRRRAEGLEIQVVDTGPGFDTERPRGEAPRLFSPFVQGDSPSVEGYGLGLHIVRALCEQSGYRLTIRSRRGRGSTFGVLIAKVF